MEMREPFARARCANARLNPLYRALALTHACPPAFPVALECVEYTDPLMFG